MLLVVIVLLATGLFYLLNSPFLARRIITSAIKKNLKGYILEDLTIGRQQWIVPDRLVFSNIQCRLKTENEFYHILIQQIECTPLTRPIRVRVIRIAFESSQIVAQPSDIQAAVFLKGLGLDRFEGEAQIPHLEAYKYRFDQMSAKIDGDLKKMALRDLKADSYEGKLFGEILLDWQKNLPYSINVHFDGVDLRPMKEANPSLGEVEGVISGSLTVEGNARNFHALDFHANVTKDGRINASLLKFVSPYIPRTQESAVLDGMMQRGEKIPIEVAVMELRSIEAHKLSGLVKLSVRKLNLDLNLPIDILYDGNLISLVKWYRRINP
jgi:hypothetical protein